MIAALFLYEFILLVTPDMVQEYQKLYNHVAAAQVQEDTYYNFSNHYTHGGSQLI